jgi:hypothetical protein
MTFSRTCRRDGHCFCTALQTAIVPIGPIIALGLFASVKATYDLQKSIYLYAAFVVAATIAIAISCFLSRNLEDEIWKTRKWEIKGGRDGQVYAGDEDHFFKNQVSVKGFRAGVVVAAKAAA